MKVNQYLSQLNTVIFVENIRRFLKSGIIFTNNITFLMLENVKNGDILVQILLQLYLFRGHARYL